MDDDDQLVTIHVIDNYYYNQDDTAPLDDDDEYNNAEYNEYQQQQQEQQQQKHLLWYTNEDYRRIQREAVQELMWITETYQFRPNTTESSSSSSSSNDLAIALRGMEQLIDGSDTIRHSMYRMQSNRYCGNNNL